MDQHNLYYLYRAYGSQKNPPDWTRD